MPNEELVKQAVIHLNNLLPRFGVGQECEPHKTLSIYMEEVPGKLSDAAGLVEIAFLAETTRIAASLRDRLEVRGAA